jgi:hypothetical protein
MCKGGGGGNGIEMPQIHLQLALAYKEGREHEIGAGTPSSSLLHARMAEEVQTLALGSTP